MPPAWEALENPDLLLRQMNLDRKRIEKHVSQEEQKRIAQAEKREEPGLAASGMTATPSNPQQPGVLTGLKDLSRSIRSRVSSPFRSNPSTGDDLHERPKEATNPGEPGSGQSEEEGRDEEGEREENPERGATAPSLDTQATMMAEEEGEYIQQASRLLSYTQPMSWQEGRTRYNPEEPHATEGSERRPVAAQTKTTLRSEDNMTEGPSEDLLAGAENTASTNVEESKITLLKRKDTEVPLEEFISKHPELLLGSGGSRIFIDEYQQLSIRAVGDSTKGTENRSPEDHSGEQEWTTALEQLSLLESTRVAKDQEGEKRVGTMITDTLTPEHRHEMLKVAVSRHAAEVAEKAKRREQERKLCTKCRRAEVTSNEDLCAKCQEEEDKDKVDASLREYAKKRTDPQAESTRIDAMKGRNQKSEITRLEMQKEKQAKMVVQTHSKQRKQELEVFEATNQMAEGSRIAMEVDDRRDRVENLQRDMRNSFQRLGLVDLHKEALEAKEFDVNRARRIYEVAEREAIPVDSFQWSEATIPQRFGDALLYKWLGQVKLIHDILISDEMTEWIQTEPQDLLTRPNELSRGDRAKPRWLNITAMARAILLLQDLFCVAPGIRGPDEGADGRTLSPYQGRPVWNLLTWLDIIQREATGEDEESGALRNAKPLKMVLWKFVRGIHTFFTYYLSDGYGDIKLKIREIARRRGDQAAESKIMSAEGQQHNLTSAAKCQDTMKEILEWNEIIVKLPIPGRLTSIQAGQESAYKNVDAEGRYQSKGNSTQGSTLPKAIRKQWQDFMQSRRHVKLDQDLSQIRWGSRSKANGDGSERDSGQVSGLNYIDEPKKGWPRPPDPSGSDSSEDNRGPPGGGGGGGRRGGGGPPDQDPDPGGNDDDEEDESEDSDTSDSDERGRKKNRKKPSKKRCRRCGSDKHPTGDPRCKKKQKFCSLCQTTAHSFKRCPWREDAPDCPKCGARAHEFPSECPARIERRRKRELKASQEDPDYLTPAGLKARMKLGSDIWGNYFLPKYIQPVSAAAAHARRRREYERQRAHDEFECEDFIERHDHIAKTRLDWAMDEVKREAIGRALKNADVDNIYALEDKRPGTLKKIEDKTTEMYIQKSVANSMGVGFKDIPLEEMGWGKDVVFRGVPGEKYPIKKFVESFDKIKDARGWDDIVSANMVAARLRGPAKVFYENLKKDHRTKNAAIFWPELKLHLWHAYHRRLDVFTRARIMQNIVWEPRTYNGSLKAYLQHIVNKTHDTYEGKQDLKMVTWREVREGEAIDKFIRTAPRAIIQRMKHEKCHESIDGFTAWLDDWEETQRSTSDSSRLGRNLQVHALSTSEQNDGDNQDEPVLDQGLMEYWETSGGLDGQKTGTTTNEALEVNAVKRGGGQKIGPCHRCHKYGHLIRDCTEPEPENDDGLETQAVMRRRPIAGPTTNKPAPRPRRKYTNIKRARKPGPRKAPMSRGKRYYSTDSGRTYRVAAVNQPNEGEVNVIVGALEDLDPLHEGNEWEEEMEHNLLPLDWEIEELPTGPRDNDNLESAAMRGPGATPRGADQLARTRLPGDRDKPEVAGLEIRGQQNEDISNPFGYDLGDGSFGSYDR